MMVTDLHLIPALSDNYIYLLRDQESQKTLIVDPGEAKPVIDFLESRQWPLHTILLTHHHHDHIDGCRQLQIKYHCEVIGSHDDRDRLPTLTQGLIGECQWVWTENVVIDVFQIPGHTHHHLGYYLKNQEILFCGDTLFSAGCGRLFEGTPQQMWASLLKLRQLPSSTQVCCSHEYSQQNIAFALKILGHEQCVQLRAQQIKDLRQKGLPTLPTMMRDELCFNPFLRADDPAIARAIGLPTVTPAPQVFAALRKQRDTFSWSL